MKKLTASFIFVFLFLLTFPLAINQLDHHLPFLVTSEPKSSDQLAREAWEYERTVTSTSGSESKERSPLKLLHFDMPILLKMGFKGINQANNNLQETVKEEAPWKTYDELSEEVKTELKNLVQIPTWEEKLKNLAKKTQIDWRKNFWDKIQKKYLSYLIKNKIDDLKWEYGTEGTNSLFFLFRYSASGLAEELRKAERITILPDVYDNGWELTIREKINTVTGKTLFSDVKTIWENTLRSGDFVDLKKYQLKEIGGVEIADLLTLTSTSKFLDFTFSQQDVIHNLVDLANYQTLLEKAINEEQEVEAFWNNPVTRKQLTTFFQSSTSITTLGGIEINQLNEDLLVNDYLTLTAEQKAEVRKLSKLTNFSQIIEQIVVKVKVKEKKQKSDQLPLILGLSLGLPSLLFLLIFGYFYQKRKKTQKNQAKN